MRAISLITDFGNKDFYAGVMKGVINSICPKASVVDITHEIKNHGIEQAALVLAASFLYFAKGTVHVVVVDPGVGGQRDPVLLESQGHCFIGPDNGVFTLVDDVRSKVYRLDKKKYWLNPVSNTFHGRDIFAPVAAYLASGVAPKWLGTLRKEKIARIQMADAQKDADGTLRARVMYVDRFGNCVTNILGSSFVMRGTSQPVEFEIGKKVFLGEIVKTYAEAANGHPVAIVGSSGFLELSLNKASFARRYSVHEGDNITVKIVK